MTDKDTLLLDRRRILYAALLGGGGAALSACGPREDTAEGDIWAGFDDRITERTLAEAEKLFGLEFTEEERRLMYVGITRARQTLTLSFARKRRRYGEIVSCEPSRFLKELPRDLMEWRGDDTETDHERRRERAAIHLGKLRELFDAGS